MGFWNRSKSQQRQAQTAAGQGRGGQSGRGAGRGAARAKAKGAAAPAVPAAPVAQRQQGASDDSIKRQIQEVRDDKLSPLGEMLSHPPNEDMSSLVDMYLGEAHASLEQLQEHIAHSSDDEAMMALVQLSSEFHGLQEQAESWKQRAAHGGSGHDATPMPSGAPHAVMPSDALGGHPGDSQASPGHPVQGSRPRLDNIIDAGGGHAAAGGDASQLREGDAVIVVTEFDAMGETPVRLKLGDKGTVDEIDVDGDACIDFEHLEDMQWVSGEDFDHLRVLPPDEMASSPSRTPQRQTPTHGAQQSTLASAQHPWEQPGQYSTQPDAQHSQQQFGHPGQSQEDADLQRALEASRQQHDQESSWAGFPPAPPAGTWSWQEPGSDPSQAQWPDAAPSTPWAQSFPSQAGHSNAPAPRHSGESSEQQQQRYSEAESTLRATLSGAGREDKEMLTFALQEARDAGVSGALIEDGDHALRELEHQKQLEGARQQLQDELDRPQRDASSLQHALTQASAAGLSDAELAPAKDALRGIGEQEEKLKAVREACHSGDPNLLRNTIEQARHSGVSETIIKKAERHLLALQFLTRYPEVDRAAMLRGWHGLAISLRQARQKLHEVLKSGANAEDVGTAVHHLEEAGGDDAEVAEGRRIADARRSAHDQVVCALVTQEPQDLQAALVALDKAGGPEADREHLKPALSAVDSDNLLLRDLDLVLPGAIRKYLEEHARQQAPPAMRPEQHGKAHAEQHAASADRVVSNFAPSAATSLAPPKPAEVPTAVQETGEPQLRGAPLSDSPAQQAVARAAAQPPAGQTSHPPVGQIAQPTPAQAPSHPASQTSQVAVRQTTVAKQSPRESSPLSVTRSSKPQSGQEKSAQRQVAEARRQEMKSKVERARQWVNYQDRAHKQQQQQQKQQTRTPQSSPTLLGQSMVHPAAPQAGLQSSHAGFQSQAMPASMPQLGGAFKMNYASPHASQVSQSYPAVFAPGQHVGPSTRHYEDPSFWR